MDAHSDSPGRPVEDPDLQLAVHGLIAAALVASALALLLAVLSPGYALARGAPRVQAATLRPEEIPPGLVGLVSEREQGRRRRTVEQTACTGFVVDTGAGDEVVTARHCLKDNTAVRIFDARERATAAGAVVSAGSDDVALVALEAGARFPRIAVGTSRTLRPGDPLCAWRVRDGGEQLFWDRSCATYLGKKTIDAGQGAHAMLLISHALEPGFSGGPVLDAGGRVVGVSVAMTDAGYDLVEPIENAARLAIASR